MASFFITVSLFVLVELFTGQLFFSHSQFCEYIIAYFLPLVTRYDNRRAIMNAAIKAAYAGFVCSLAGCLKVPVREPPRALGTVAKRRLCAIDMFQHSRSGG